jgi:type II secretory pathway component PulK
MHTCARRGEDGVALLLVLWVITLLALICAEFSWTMRTETAIATGFKETQQAYYRAEAGINRAVIELLHARTQRRPSIAPDAETDEDDENDEQLWEPGGSPYSFTFADGTCTVLIEDETNKIGLNAFLTKHMRDPTPVKILLQQKLGLEGELRDTIADSLIDWVDKDDNITGVHGAESDYYQTLDPPYECRNAPIPVIEELLLINGIDEKIFFGRTRSPEQKTRLTREELERLLAGEAAEETLPEPVQHSVWESDDEDGVWQDRGLGLVDIFSAGSGSSQFKININTATVQQLMLLEGMRMETAQEIIAERTQRRFASTSDRLPQYPHYEIWKNDITVGSRLATGYYRLSATGYSADKRVARTISCNIRLTGNRALITNWKSVN